MALSVERVDRRPVALSIAGSDSSGGAGIVADVKTFEAHGAWSAVAVTAVTAQDTTGVYAIHPVPPEVVVAQIERVTADFHVRAAKTGMLANAAIVEAVAGAIAEAVARGRIGDFVVDPVLLASHGQPLLDADAEVVARLLVPMATVVTPNLAEAAALLGAGAPVADRAGMEGAARQLVDLGARAALVTGGHLSGDLAADCLLEAGRAGVVWLESTKLDQLHSHGSGCVLSAAITARLARGDDVEHACRSAKAWISGAIAAGSSLGHGIGPVDPAWERVDPGSERA